MTKKVAKLKDTLEGFLFNEIKQNGDYQVWAKDYELDGFIVDNLSKTLRSYQIEALKAFIWCYENNPKKARHLLFNMATGTGKTLVMAAAVLYLYEQGYRNFVFLVHQVQIKDQAIKNFTDPSFEKYLFAKTVKFAGKRVPIKAVDHFFDAKKEGINFLFFSTQMLYNNLIQPKENTVTGEDFTYNKVVIIADEAHRLNVHTKKRLNQSEKKEIQNWETAVNSAINANDKNLLLEFTATVDLNNDAIRKKYQDKLVYKYDFLAFNEGGYSKKVAFLYNEETQIADQKRLLIVNAVALSEYRRLFAERELGVIINPVILVKSTQIKQSADDRAFFHKVVNSLKIEDFDHLKNMGKGKQLSFDDITSPISHLFGWLSTKKPPLPPFKTRAVSQGL